MRWDEWRGSLDDRPTMWVRHLLKTAWLTIDLHKFVAADDPGCFHTHPATALRIILWNGYTEQMESGHLRFWFAGDVGIVRPELCHRIDSLHDRQPCYTLWVRFRKVATIELRGPGWQPQRNA